MPFGCEASTLSLETEGLVVAGDWAVFCGAAAVPFDAVFASLPTLQIKLRFR